MIPTFPNFKSIEVSDQEEIKAFTKKHLPYSNFSFVSLFCWDVAGKGQISRLNGNLVVRLADDKDNKDYFSFLGTEDVPETISALLQHAREEKQKPILRLIPEETLEHCAGLASSLVIKEDRDNFDYICSAAELAALRGHKYANLRQSVNCFKKKYDGQYQVKFFTIRPEEKKEIMAVWKQWQCLRESYSEQEEAVLIRLLEHADSFDLLNAMLLVNDVPVAFSINEWASEVSLISHFAKADYNFKGALAFLDNETARYLGSQGCLYINLEEDMGLPSIRRAKEKYRPVGYLRKYTVKEKYATIKAIISLFRR